MPKSRLIAVVAPLGLLVSLSMAFAECGGEHKATAPATPVNSIAEGRVGTEKTKVMVTGAPGQSVEVKAPESYSVSAVGGAGTPGKAGAAGKPGQ